MPPNSKILLYLNNALGDTWNEIIWAHVYGIVRDIIQLLTPFTVREAPRKPWATRGSHRPHRNHRPHRLQHFYSAPDSQNRTTSQPSNLFFFHLEGPEREEFANSSGTNTGTLGRSCSCAPLMGCGIGVGWGEPCLVLTAGWDGKTGLPMLTLRELHQTELSY